MENYEMHIMVKNVATTEIVYKDVVSMVEHKSQVKRDNHNIWLYSISTWFLKDLKEYLLAHYSDVVGATIRRA